MSVKPTLPFDDKDTKARKADLDAQQQTYQFNYKPAFFPEGDDSFDNAYLATLAGETVPPVEDFTGSYMRGRAWASLRILTNRYLVKAWKLFDRFDSLEDYNDNLFIQLPGGMPRPEIAKTFKNDYAFAAQRISGVNPLRITAFDKDDDRKEILERIRSPEWKAKAFNLLANSQLFITDYSGNDPTWDGPAKMTPTAKALINDVWVPKFQPKPVAFYYVDVETKLLMPLAIEVTRGGRVFTPDDENRGGLQRLLRMKKDDWLFAKTCVNCADGSHHQLFWHLGRVHFAMEPIIVCTNRQLHQSHPLKLLLATHMRFHLTNNKSAHDTLVAPNGSVDNLFAPVLGQSLKISLDAVKSFDFSSMSFPEEVAARGLAERRVLEDYPFRDDGMLLWDALYDHVHSYVTHFYASNEILAKDAELQAWAKEIAMHAEAGGGGVTGFPSAITSIAVLTKLITTFIFICGPLHSAINFLQYEYQALSSNMPLACWADPEKLAKQGAISRKTFLSMLPPHGPAEEQMQIMFFLSAYRHDKFGEYEKSYKDLYDAGVSEVFSEHPEVVGIMTQFSKKLEEVEEVIEQRNAMRKVKYNGFKPSLVLNSTSI